MRFRRFLPAFALTGAVGIAYLAGLAQIGPPMLSRRNPGDRQSRQKFYDTLLLEQTIARESPKTRYIELNTIFDRELEQRAAEASLWKQVLSSGSENEERAVVEHIRSQLLSKLKPWPGPDLPLEPRYRGPLELPDVEGQLVEITTHAGVRLTGALVKGEGAEPRPALLVLHGMYGGIDQLLTDTDYHHALAAKLVQAGYTVFVPLRVGTTINSRNTLYVKAQACGWSLEAFDLWQLVRAVDFLRTLEDVDPAHLGVVGISLGGQHALWLGALDNRISAVVSIGYFTERFPWLVKRPDGDPTRSPGDAFSQTIRPYDNVLFAPSMTVELDDVNLAALIRPRFLALACGTSDPRYSPARSTFENVRRLYEDQLDRIQFIDFDGGHETNLETIIPFLNRWRQETL